MPSLYLYKKKPFLIWKLLVLSEAVTVTLQRCTVTSRGPIFVAECFRVFPLPWSPLVDRVIISLVCLACLSRPGNPSSDWCSRSLMSRPYMLIVTGSIVSELTVRGDFRIMRVQWGNDGVLNSIVLVIASSSITTDWDPYQKPRM